MSTQQYVLEVFTGSDGERTRALYSKLDSKGPVGRVVMNLMRAHKNSARAKLYRGGPQGGGSFKAMAYERKRWSMEQLVVALRADDCGLLWGWKEDPDSPSFPHILFVELPTGQVSFHTDSRGEGPEFPKAWDGVRKAGTERLCKFAAIILEGQFNEQQHRRNREVCGQDPVDAGQRQPPVNGSRDGRRDQGSLSLSAPGPRRDAGHPGQPAEADAGTAGTQRSAPEPHQGAGAGRPPIRRPQFDQLTQGWGSDHLDDLGARIELVSEFWKSEGRGAPAEDKVFAAMVKRKIVLEESLGKNP